MEGVFSKRGGVTLTSKLGCNPICDRNKTSTIALVGPARIRYHFVFEAKWPTLIG